MEERELSKHFWSPSSLMSLTAHEAFVVVHHGLVEAMVSGNKELLAEVEACAEKMNMHDLRMMKFVAGLV